VAPRDVLLRLLPPTPTPEEIEKKLEDGIIVDAHQSYVVEVVGNQRGRGKTYSYIITPPSLRQVQKAMPGATHESFLTGTSASEILGGGKIKIKGVIAPECLSRSERELFLSKLAQHEIDIELRTESRLN
jgi:hypothetical protein